MLQEGKQALDYEMDNQYGAVETEGQVVAGRGEKLVAHDVGRGDAHQNGHTKDGGHKYPQVGEDSLVPHLRRNCKGQIISQDFKKKVFIALLMWQFQGVSCFIFQKHLKLSTICMYRIFIVHTAS